MVRNVKTILIAACTLVSCSIYTAYGQKKKGRQVGFYKNAIYASVGSLGLSFTATGYYERIVSQRGKIASFIKVGAGGYAAWGGSGSYILGQYGILTGIKKHHLELGAGPSYFTSGGLDALPFTATMGWRVQDPGSNFMFRMGFSYPESIYIGIGIAF